MKPLIPVVSISPAATWQAEVLQGPPLIAPATHIVLPHAVPGEEDALARGALWVKVKPRIGGWFLLQCALGFAGGDVLHGVFSTPDPDVLLAVAGGYAYRVDTTSPETGTLLPFRPVTTSVTVQEPASLVLVGFHAVHVFQREEDWTSPRLSWEGITLAGMEGDLLGGTGWHMRTDRELPFTLNLRTREVTGGGFLP